MIIVIMGMSLVAMVMVVVMIAKAVGIASLDNGDRGILLPATPNAAKLAR